MGIKACLDDFEDVSRLSYFLVIWEISKGARVDKVKDRRLCPVICLQISCIFLWKEQKDVFFCDRSDD